MSKDLSVKVAGVVFPNPVIAASGTYGFGEDYAPLYPLNRLGGISCKGTTINEKAGNLPPRIAETTAGMLNSVGLQNPGVDVFIKKYLPELEHMYTATRVSDLKNKTVEQLRNLRDSGVNEISLGVESGDAWTLKRINKGYAPEDILEQCHKLEEAGIQYWVTFLNGVAGREHSEDHAIHTAEIFNQLKPMLVGTGGLTLFPGTPLLEEARRGEFTPLTERELMQELKLFLERLTCDCELNTHHTSSMNLSGPFLARKKEILDSLQYGIDHFDMDKLTKIRNKKRTL